MCFGAYWHLKLFIASLGYFGVGEPEGNGESPVALRLWHRPCIVMVLSEQVQSITIPMAVRNPNGSRPCSAGFPSVFWTRIFSGSVGSARWLLCCARCIFWELSFPKITFVKVVLCDMFEMLSLWRHNGFLIPGF